MKFINLYLWPGQPLLFPRATRLLSHLATGAALMGTLIALGVTGTGLLGTATFAQEATICLKADGTPTPCPIPVTLKSLIDEYQTILAQSNPFEAGGDGDPDALRKLPDVSPASEAKRIAQLHGLHDKLRQLNISSLSETDQLTYTLLDFVLIQRGRRDPFDEGRIPFTNDNGFYSEMLFVAKQTSFEKTSDFEAYASRLSALPRYFGQNKENMRRGIKTGYVAYAEILPSIMDTIKTLATSSAAEHPLYQPFTQIPDSLTESEKSRLEKLGEAAMNNAVIPAYKDLLVFFEKEYQPKARNTPGIGDSPENRAHYTSLVRYYTTLDITPDEVHEIGLKEVKRIRGEMNVIISDLGFEGTFAEFLAFLRSDPQFYATSKEGLLKEAAWIAKQIDGKMPEYFRTLPRLSYGVAPVPESIAANYTTGRYWGGNPLTGKAGHYMVNTHDLKQRPLYNLPALTLHEGVPGHHHQISLAQELTDIPLFRRNLYVSAFGEGWGLYSEKLGVEMGIYNTPYENFGRLTYEMWRACRLVVDTGIHWRGWSKAQAESCFLENSALAKHNIKTEVERYISWPGQALSYKMGELKILELRKRAEAALGEQFSLRDFHDAVLLKGSLPLEILEKEINSWIESNLTAATKTSLPVIAPQ